MQWQVADILKKNEVPLLCYITGKNLETIYDTVLAAGVDKVRWSEEEIE